MKGAATAITLSHGRAWSPADDRGFVLSEKPFQPLQSPQPSTAAKALAVASTLPVFRPATHMRPERRM